MIDLSIRPKLFSWLTVDVIFRIYKLDLLNYKLKGLNYACVSFPVLVPARIRRYYNPRSSQTLLQGNSLREFGRLISSLSAKTVYTRLPPNSLSDMVK